MQEIIDKLGHTYPMNLNLVDQGTFSMQAFFQKADKKETGSEDENTKEETK